MPRGDVRRRFADVTFEVHRVDRIGESPAFDSGVERGMQQERACHHAGGHPSSGRGYVLSHPFHKSPRSQGCEEIERGVDRNEVSRFLPAD